MRLAASPRHLHVFFRSLFPAIPAARLLNFYLLTGGLYVDLRRGRCESRGAGACGERATSGSRCAAPGGARGRGYPCDGPVSPMSQQGHASTHMDTERRLLHSFIVQPSRCVPALCQCQCTFRSGGPRQTSLDIQRPARPYRAAGPWPRVEASSKGCRGIFTLCEHYRSFCASSTSRNSSHAAGCLLRGFFMSCLSSKTRLTTEEDVDVTQTCDG